LGYTERKYLKKMRKDDAEWHKKNLK
jgi:hypothetical protein